MTFQLFFFIGYIDFGTLDWWDHKEMSPWILPCLIKSQSPMSAEDWDNTPATTNTGEAQHHWTKTQTGSKLSLVEAIETYVMCYNIHIYLLNNL